MSDANATIKVNLTPEVASALLAKANAAGLPLEALAEQILGQAAPQEHLQGSNVPDAARKWYEKKRFILLFLFTFPLLGVVLLYRTQLPKWVKKLGLFFALIWGLAFLIIGAVSSETQPSYGSSYSTYSSPEQSSSISSGSHSSYSSSAQTSRSSGGRCDYEDQYDSAGRRCGRRAASVRAGGRLGGTE